MESDPAGYRNIETIECAIALIIADQQVNSRLIELSEAIAQRSDPARPQLVLNATNALPHVTLAMMTVDVESMSRLRSEVHMLAYPRSIRLHNEVAPYKSDIEDPALWIEVIPDELLEEAHRQAMALRSIFHRQNAQGASRCLWIDDFQLHAFERYRPHITVGRGRLIMEHSLSEISVSLQLVELGEQCVVTGVL